MEDNDHIWTCPESRDAYFEVGSTTLGMINVWGRIATKYYNKNRKKERKKENPRQDQASG